MKNWSIFFFVSIMILLVSCQEEEQERINPDLDNTIPKDSELASLMRKVVTHDGSFDDIVDSGNCFSINLPYTILLNEKEFIVTTINDYQKIATSDVIEIRFPVTITLYNHTRKIIENRARLAVFSNSCKVDDDDIECIDFVYPIMFSTFNNNTNRLNTIEVGHDSQMFDFMSAVNDNTSVSINYPINLLLHNGQNVDTSHNIDLLHAIMDVASACEENDN